MKTQKTIAIVGAILLLAYHIEATAYKCSLKDSNDNLYNISGLYKQGGYSFQDIHDLPDDIIKTYFKFNLCEGITTNCTYPSEVGAYHEAVFSGESIGACTNLGVVDKAEPIISQIGKNTAVNVTYTNGDYCFYSDGLDFYQEKPYQITFLVYCSSDSEATWKQIENNGNDVTECTPRFEIYHPAGCMVSGGGSFFWKVFKVGIILLVLYLILGYIYNVKYNGKRGMNAIPLIDIWRSLFEGISSTVGALRSLAMGSVLKPRSGGESIMKFSTGPVKYEVI